MSADNQVMSRLEFARRAAREAEGVIMRHFRADSGGTRFRTKPDGSPVTAADVGAEELVRDLIGKHWSRDGVLGEECGHTEGSSGYRWVIDPIDGTKSYVHGVPLFGTLIGVQRRGEGRGSGAEGRGETDRWESVAGVANFPALRECAWGALGGGAWCSAGDGEIQRARVSSVATLTGATVSTTSPRAMMEPGALAFYQRLNQRCKLSRGWSDCYGTLLVITGRIEVMIDPPMKLWDVCALEPIVAEAGGRLTGWDGAPTDGATGAIATNGLVHDEVIGLVRGG